jgi:tRNA U55 pseudouridine synthase TruB
MLTHQDLHSLEHYSASRSDYKRLAVEHRKRRQIKLGQNITLHFEDRMTVQYQIQEMLLIERTFNQQGIQDELDAYTPLIPTGTNFKVTLTIEYGDPELRAAALTRLHGVEDRVYVRVEDCAPVYAIADEDLDRSTDTKTAAVHFLRFELTEDMINALKHDQAALTVGVDHAEYTHTTRVHVGTVQLLLQDFDQQPHLVLN